MRHMSATPTDQPTRTWSSWYTLFVLTIVYAVNIADRFVISTFIEPIKRDLNLSDSCVGFPDGTGLAIFYSRPAFPSAISPTGRIGAT